MKRKGKNEVKYLTAEERKDFMEAVKHAGNTRDIVVYELLFKTGLRISELTGLNIEKVKGKRFLNIRGKGDKERTIPLTEDIRALLEGFIVWKQGNGESIHPRTPLFLNKNGKRISPRGLRDRTYFYCRKAGLEREFSPHAFRHTCGFTLGKNNIPIQVIQKILGHSNINTTRIYTEPDIEQVEQALYTLGGPSRELPKIDIYGSNKAETLTGQAV